MLHILCSLYCCVDGTKMAAVLRVVVNDERDVLLIESGKLEGDGMNLL